MSSALESLLCAKTRFRNFSHATFWFAVLALAIQLWGLLSDIVFVSTMTISSVFVSLTMDGGPKFKRLIAVAIWAAGAWLLQIEFLRELSIVWWGIPTAGALFACTVYRWFLHNRVRAQEHQLMVDAGFPTILGLPAELAYRIFIVSPIVIVGIVWVSSGATWNLQQFLILMAGVEISFLLVVLLNKTFPRTEARMRASLE